MQKAILSPNFNVSVNANDELCISGRIDLNNVTAACAQGSGLIDTLSKVTVNLSGLTDADSSILALMVEWIRSAKKQNKDIIFNNSPQFLLDLGRVSGLDAILPISKPLEFHQ